MKKTYTAFVFIMLAGTIASCEKIFLEKDPANNPVVNFDLLWKTLDEKYSLFAFKKINWDSVYHVFRPMVYDGMSNQELFKVMSDMLFLLKDGHTNLFTPFDRSRNWEWYLNAPPNFNFNIIERNYLGADYQITGPLLNTIIDSVGYIYYASFGSDVGSEQIVYVISRFRHLKGIIIDIRDNSGGNTQNVTKIVSALTVKKVLTHYQLYKTGPGHHDFSDPEPHYIEPYSVSSGYTKPIALLTNRKCYSATNDFVLAMKALPNVVTIGDTTGGGGGVPIYSELPNGWVYRFSSTVTLSPSGFNVEAGIPPDIRVDMNPFDELNGIDSILERALHEINNR